MILKRRERDMVRQLALDCESYGLSELDSLEYIKERYGKPISRSYYYKVKKLITSDLFVDKWFNHFCKIGYVAAHKKAIEEMELLQSKAKELLYKELAKDLKNIDQIMKISERIESQNRRLEELYTAGPILSKVRSIIQQTEGKIPSIGS